MTFPGYTRLLGPELLDLPSGAHVSTPAEYIVWHEHHVVRRGAQTWESPEPARVYVGRGRWLAECHWCDEVMLTHPEWRLACCPGCGARYEDGKLPFPEDPDAIADVLCRRVKRENQNWLPGETVDDLEAENAEHGVA